MEEVLHHFLQPHEPTTNCDTFMDTHQEKREEGMWRSWGNTNNNGVNLDEFKRYDGRSRDGSSPSPKSYNVQTSISDHRPYEERGHRNQRSYDEHGHRDYRSYDDRENRDERRHHDHRSYDEHGHRDHRSYDERDHRSPNKQISTVSGRKFIHYLTAYTLTIFIKQLPDYLFDSLSVYELIFRSRSKSSRKKDAGK